MVIKLDEVFQVSDKFNDYWLSSRIALQVMALTSKIQFLE